MLLSNPQSINERKMKATMKTRKSIYVLSLLALVLLPFGCSKDQLQVGNPNAPTFGGNVKDEAGLTALSIGGVYTNGFQNGDGWLGNSYFSINWAFMELMADHVGADAANQNISTMNIPDKTTLSDGTVLINSGRAIPLERTYNNRPATGAGYNYIYYQWLNAYALNTGCNSILASIPNVTFTGDAATKENTFKAWAYWWKGWAYAAVGSLYYTGLIVDGLQQGVSITNNNYVTHDKIIAQSNKFYLKADSVLKLVTNTSDYNTVIGGLIPPAFQTGHGNPPSVAEWQRNIQSMLARNILVNKLSPVGPAFDNPNISNTITKSTTTTMTAADWNQVLTYANAGVKSTDNVFAGHSSPTNTVFTTTGGNAAANSAGSNKTTTLKIGERLIQNFHNGDAYGTDNRLQNFTLAYNSATPTVYLNVNFGTRWSLWRFISGSQPATPLPTGTYQYASWADGVYEVYIGTSYEENELMKAEANIMLGNVDAGADNINNVRAYQGAGVTAIAHGLTQKAVLAELLRERQTALVFRGLAFYDARRWGWIYDESNGGGRTGVTFLKSDGTLLTASQNYNFLDYWDVPADEFVLNPPPGNDMTLVINPNFE